MIQTHNEVSVDHTKSDDSSGDSETESHQQNK
jgi:hypothetical protein